VRFDFFTIPHNIAGAFPTYLQALLPADGQDFVFEGIPSRRHYSERSVQQVIDRGASRRVVAVNVMRKLELGKTETASSAVALTIVLCRQTRDPI
jgi:hypothetical protein